MTPTPPSSSEATPSHLALQVVSSSSAIPETSGIYGSRIVNLDLLQAYTGKISEHATQCTGKIMLSGEVRHGLVSILSYHCNKCSEKIVFQTSDKVPGPNGNLRWEVNLGAVSGQLAIGGGHVPLRESMSVMGIPVMSEKTFMRTERAIGEWWEQRLKDSMLEAGREERLLAIENGSYHEGVPAITVIVDGGWSKRSLKHSYNAESGVGVIIGKNTGKLLHIGVRNKYCTGCVQGHAKDTHTCYRIWDKSSSEMESDIILEGFCQAELTHGLRYTRVIGDGDSSVYTTLLQYVPGWGRDIIKLECANHACKCYWGSLEKLVTENSSYKGKGGLTLKMLKRLTSAARCAIKMRSKEPDRRNAINLLRKDLLNGPLHCFGHHQKCSSDFCTTSQQRQAQNSTSTEERRCDDQNENEDPSTSSDETIEQNIQGW